MSLELFVSFTHTRLLRVTLASAELSCSFFYLFIFSSFRPVKRSYTISCSYWR